MIKLENIQQLVGNHVAPYIYNAKNFTAGIHDWHVAYIQSLYSGFIADPSMHTVRTSARTTIYPDSGTIMSPPVLVPLNSSGMRPATAAQCTPGHRFSCLLLLWLSATC